MLGSIAVILLLFLLTHFIFEVEGVYAYFLNGVKLVWFWGWGDLVGEVFEEQFLNLKSNIFRIFKNHKL